MPSPVNVSRRWVDDWEHAFVTGNGRHGAASYGGPHALRLTLSHERLFLPLDEPLDPPDTGGALERLRDLLYARNFQPAADEVMALATAADRRYRALRQIDPFIGAATLTFVPHRNEDPGGDWRRTVDFGTGVVTGRWADYRHDVFVSRPHDVVVIRIRAGHDVAGRLHLGPIRAPAPAAIGFRSTATPTGLAMAAAFTQRWDADLVGYQVTCELHLIGGSASADLGGTSISVNGCEEVLLLARIGLTRAGTASPERPAIPTDYDTLLAAHVDVHQSLFDRCRLELTDTDTGDGDGDGDEDEDEDIPTEELIGRPTSALVRRLFDAGRYAIISASGEHPPNLQGVWSGTYDPAWRGGYSFDGNLPAALAAVAATGTPELLLPLFDLVDEHLDDFRGNAERLYRLPGILIPPHVSTHGRHNHFTERWCLTFWTGGAAWLARLYYDYWRYTGDRDFLRRRALPFMREAASFYAGFVSDHNAALCFAPSYSPENAPAGTQAQACVNATMDVALVRDLLTNLVAATASETDDDPGQNTDPGQNADPGRKTDPDWEADRDSETDTRLWLDLLARLPDYRIDEDGSLAEWLWPGLNNNHSHRHASHLFGLWYEPDDALLDNPALRRAAINSVRLRLAWWRDHGDEMAFGLVQLGLAAACLGLADEAHEILGQLCTRYWRANLVSTHNAGSIFNTDICGGLPALVAAMLASSRRNLVRLLPALPRDWPAGSIHGVLLRGGLRVEHLTWSPDLVEADLVCSDDRELTVTVRDQIRATVSAPAGQRLHLSFR